MQCWSLLCSVYAHTPETKQAYLNTVRGCLPQAQVVVAADHPDPDATPAAVDPSIQSSDGLRVPEPPPSHSPRKSVKFTGHSRGSKRTDMLEALATACRTGDLPSLQVCHCPWQLNNYDRIVSTKSRRRAFRGVTFSEL